jgi:DNA-binding transcriptional regulator of glucitol operon
VSLPRRLALILGVIVAASGCLALGWWQWTRYESNAGSFQNLGYAVQWPMFAAFCVYAYRKFVRLEQSPPDARDADGDVTEIPAGLLPERPARPSAPRDEQDATLREYNAYLAELAAQDRAATAQSGTGPQAPQQNRTP